jgi:enamine deaminase RidA (YjgF/YER057c/UK114 family)
MDSSYVSRNRVERERLGALVARLGDDDLRCQLDHGWTISATLAHLGFWDRLTLEALEEWERTGVRSLSSDWDAVNAENLDEWLARPPRGAAEDALAAAEAVDRQIEALAPDLVEAILGAGRLRSVDRSIHRREHLDQIERTLRGQSVPERIRVSSGSPFEPTIGFSRAVRIGNRVLVSGTAPIWPDGSVDSDPEIQARRCFEIILTALREAGASPEHVVRTRMYLRSAEDADAVTRAHGAIFHAVRPAATMIVVAGFLDPRWKVEIEAEAVID